MLSYIGMTTSRRKPRACQKNSRTFKELYDESHDFTSFLQSDEEDSGSDLEDEILGEDGLE